MDWLSVKLCDHYKADILLLKLRINKKPYPEIKHLVWTIIDKHFRSGKNTEYSLSELGAFFTRDHATVLHGIRTIKGYMETDRELRQLYSDLSQEFYVCFVKVGEVLNETDSLHEMDKDIINMLFLGYEGKPGRLPRI